MPTSTGEKKDNVQRSQNVKKGKEITKREISLIRFALRTTIASEYDCIQAYTILGKVIDRKAVRHSKSLIARMTKILNKLKREDNL